MTSRGYFLIWSWVIRRDPDPPISDREKWPNGFQKVILSESLINQDYYKHLFNWPSVIFVRKTAKFLEHRENSRMFRQKWIKMSVKWASGLNLLIKWFSTSIIHQMTIRSSHSRDQKSRNTRKCQKFEFNLTGFTDTRCT